MPYKVCTSEKLRKSGADAETKAMLYLMNFRKDSSEMNYFVVDFFNDVTGMDRMGRKLWDVTLKELNSLNRNIKVSMKLYRLVVCCLEKIMSRLLLYVSMCSLNMVF